MAKKCCQILIFETMQLLTFTKPILKEVFINYIQNKVIYLPNNVVVKGNYNVLLILND